MIFFCILVHFFHTSSTLTLAFFLFSWILFTAIMRSIPTSNSAHRDHVIDGDSIPEAWWNGTRTQMERVAMRIKYASVNTWDEYKQLATRERMIGLGWMLFVVIILIGLIVILHRRNRISLIKFHRRACMFCDRCIPGSPNEHFVHPCKHVECISRTYLEKNK